MIASGDITQTSGVSAVAVTGSKGGVGKSNLAANLAVALGRWGRRVLLVDGDLGLANLDVLLGLLPRQNVDHLIRGEVGLAEVLIDGPPGIQVLPAGSGIPQLASLSHEARTRLLTALVQGSCDVDDVLVDTGAGLGHTTLALQLAASRVVVVTTPEPTSLVDAYATLKVLWTADPKKHVDVVVNAAEDDDEAQRSFEQISKAAQRFLGREPGWLGPVYRDPRVGEAVRRQRSLLELFPDAPAGRCYERIALQLTLSPKAAEAPEDYWQRLLPTTGKELSH